MPPDTTPVDPTIPSTDSEPVDMPPVAPKAPTEAPTPVAVKDDNLSPNPPEGQPAETLEEPESTVKTASASSQNQTAQTTLNEPLAPAPRSFISQLLANARFAIQTRKRKKLDHIMTMFAKRTKITNDEVEKLLHVSDATATRYLEILVREGKIVKMGKTGEGMTYSRI
jgi:predicted HTH transcriptional regulator